MSTEAQIKASNKYTKVIALRLNKKTDMDILKKLESVPNKVGYIKELIRKDISNK